MPINDVKYKVSTLAKELELKTKEILDIIAKAGVSGKTQSGSLDETEFNLVFDYLTLSHQIDNIDSYMNGELVVDRPTVKTALPEKEITEKT